MTDTTENAMKRTQVVGAKLREIPPEKLRVKIVRTIIGLILAVVGVGAHVIWPKLPDLVAFGTFGFGLVTASGELLMHPFKLFTARIGDLMDAIRGKRRDPDTGSTIPPGTV